MMILQRGCVGIVSVPYAFETLNMFISFEFIPVCITSVRLVSLSLVFFVMHVE